MTEPDGIGCNGRSEAFVMKKRKNRLKERFFTSQSWRIKSSIYDRKYDIGFMHILFQ